MKINYVHTKLIHNKSAAREILPFLITLFHSKSIIDVGCGTGSWLSVAKELGVKTIKGVDGILVDDNLLEISKEEFAEFNLALPLPSLEKYDMAICLEVAEHLPDESADSIIKSLTNASDVILFSAAIPGQGGQYHVNEQWPDYWQNKFKSNGYLTFDFLREIFWENKNIEWWYRQNMLLFVKKEKTSLVEYSPTEVANKIVHPENFEAKLFEIARLQEIIKDRILEPKLIPSVKLAIKSILNALK
jgi:SAM-dependent methyltransferase